MTAMLEMPRVRECTALGCSYNDHTACHAFAISISEVNGHCDTFIDIGVHGGLDIVTAQVGACHRADCAHNLDLECRADAIRVGPGQDVADCLTYLAR
jgi:hypothetical protein